MPPNTTLSAFRTFVRFALVWFCLFPLPLGVWEGLRFVIVALLGLLVLTIFYSFKSTYIHRLMLYGTGFDKKLEAYINHLLK